MQDHTGSESVQSNGEIGAGQMGDNIIIETDGMPYNEYQLSNPNLSRELSPRTSR